MALSKPYVTLAAVKEYCGITDTAEDTRIENSINITSRLIDSLTDSFFYQKNFTDYYLPITGGGNGWKILARPYDKKIGGLILTPANVPIISVTQIEEWDMVLVENTDYYINAELGQIERVGQWIDDPRKIKITCSIGYATTDDLTPSADIPEDIAFYALEIAARLSGQFKKEQPSLDGTIVNINSHDVPKWIVTELKKRRPINL
jgi:hypothetical protein